jgi:8-oxo-dGTP pyrophosphatase MutT (NUDIX family)
MDLYSKKKITRKSLKTNFEQKVYNQVGALCYKIVDDKTQVLLITSRKSKRWIIPKGWKIDKLSNTKSVALEAWEEAGVQGKVSNRSIGTYDYRKKNDSGDFFTCRVNVYGLKVKSLKRKFPEQGQRQLQWVDADRAIEYVFEPELKKLITEFVKSI